MLSTLKMFEWVAFTKDIWLHFKYLIIDPAFIKVILLKRKNFSSKIQFFLIHKQRI